MHNIKLLTQDSFDGNSERFSNSLNIKKSTFEKKKLVKGCLKLSLSPFIDMKPNNYILKYYFQFKEFEFFLWKKTLSTALGLEPKSQWKNFELNLLI